jgi:DtxR family Mn-dependent transcriptional regulator
MCIFFRKRWIQLFSIFFLTNFDEPGIIRAMTQSLEDYLEMVSFLADDGEVRVTDIATRLSVSKPSVLTALKTLKGLGLLEHERYRSVALTEKGTVQAAEIRGRHTFLTIFLHEVVGVSLENAEKDACKMEHILCDETLKKMEQLTQTQKKKAHSTVA